MRAYLFAACLLVLDLLPLGARAQSTELSNAEAKAYLEQVWNSQNITGIPLGAATVITGPAGDNRPHTCGNGLLNVGEFYFLKNAESTGLFSVVEEQSSQQFRQGQSFSWGQMLDATTAGVSQKIIIRATSAFRALDVSASLPPEQRQANCLKYRMGTFRITSIVRNELQRRGVTDYRVLFVTYTANWTTEYRQIQAANRVELSDARKAIVLLKQDAFAAKWKLLAADLANANAEFTTSNVTTMLAAAK
jgi:hypothetical protein